MMNPWITNSLRVLDEEKVKSYLQTTYPHWVERYQDLLHLARRTVLQRLVAAFWRENIGGFAERAKSRQDLFTKDIDLTAFPDTYRYYPLGQAELLVIPIVQEFAYRRIQLEDDVLHIMPKQSRKIIHPVAFLSLVKSSLSTDFPDFKWKEFERELCNAGANQALAYLWKEHRDDQIKQINRKVQANHLLEFVQKTGQKSEVFFEQFCVEGHHIHPCAKTKLGMSPDAVTRFSAECQNRPMIAWIAVRKEFIQGNLLDSSDPNLFIDRFFPNLKEQIPSSFDSLADEYQFLPVHRWQMEQIIPELYQEEIAKKILIPMAHVETPAKASSSFRTLYPLGSKGSVKVAVHSQMTSTVRSISPQTAINAAEFSRLIDQVLTHEPQLAGTFIPIREWGGFYFRSSDSLKRRNLSVVFREERILSQDEIAMVASALYDQSPITGKPILVDVVQCYAQARGETSLPKAAYQWWKHYVSIALQGFLTLMVKYGIGLEGHMQNSVPIFQQGKPVKMMFRDWGGVRIHVQRLQKQGIAINFHPQSLTVVHEEEKMREKVFYTVYQSHLGELIIQLCQRYGLSEEQLWKEVARSSDQILEEISMDKRWHVVCQKDRMALFEKFINHKALAIMRLSDQPKDQFVRVLNPLYNSLPS